MADARYTIPCPLEAERIMTAQVRDHAPALDGQGRPTPACATCGRLPPGLDLLTHPARSIRNRLVQAGQMDHREPTG